MPPPHAIGFPLVEEPERNSHDHGRASTCAHSKSDPLAIDGHEYLPDDNEAEFRERKREREDTTYKSGPAAVPLPLARAYTRAHSFTNEARLSLCRQLYPAPLIPDNFVFVSERRVRESSSGESRQAQPRGTAEGRERKGGREDRGMTTEGRGEGGTIHEKPNTGVRLHVLRRILRAAGTIAWDRYRGRTGN